MSKPVTFVVAIAIQLTLLMGIIGFHFLVVTNGTDVLLRIVPVDPRDPLRGDYENIQYNISSIPEYMLQGSSVQEGATVYVVLQKQAQTWEMRRVQLFEPSNDELFIKGRINYITTVGNAHVAYGIEQYFIPEGSGQNMTFQNGNATARVAISKNGYASLRQVYVDDKPWP